MFLISVLTICVLFYIWIKRKYTYWERKGIKGPTPQYVVGNFGDILSQKKSPDQFFRGIYEQYADEKAVGLYQGFRASPLVLRDLELIKAVLIKDFPLFQDRGMRATEDRFSDNLFIIEGEGWKILRSKLTPIFTSGKLKNMVPLIDRCIDEYLSYVDNLVENNKQHEIRALVGKYTLGVIGSCAFGVDLDAFSEKQNKFRDMANRIFNASTFEKFLHLMEMILPGSNNLLFKYFSITAGSQMKHFFLSLVRNLLQEREGKPKTRNDFMDLLITLKEQGKIQRRDDDKTTEINIDDELLAAQALIFYAGGFETSAATMSFMLHELGINNDLQDKALKDIRNAMEKHNDAITYDSIKDMPYLEMVFDETLRKYPVIGVLIRQASVNYTFSGTNIKIEKGTQIMIPISGLQKDPKYYPNPEVFDPERFSPENKLQIPQCAYLPFGDGPRNCIGLRFAKVQSMMAMASFLNKYKVSPTERTKPTLKFNASSRSLTPEDGIWLKISRR